MSKFAVGLGSLLLLGLGALVIIGDEAPPTSTRVQNLRAFAKAYGYVRFFHPSDEAAEIDWERFAVYGSSVVRDAADSAELAATLRRLFAPIAPTVTIYNPLTDTLPPLDLTVEDPSAFDTVAWQHLGVGLGPGIYQSARTNRERIQNSPGAGFGTISQGVDAAAHRGREFRLRAAVRTAVVGSGNQGQLWLRVDRPERQPGFFDNMGDRPITRAEWSTYEIVGKVDDDADKIVFGCFLMGSGKVWTDSIELSVKNDEGVWVRVSVINGDFEQSDTPIGWFAASPGYDYSVAAGSGFESPHSLLIQDRSSTILADLFDGAPAVGELIDKPLGRGLRIRVPLALYSKGRRTLGEPDKKSHEELIAALDGTAIDALSPEDADLRFGGVIIAWNVFQHFYPYFDVVQTDWDQALTDSLTDATDDKTGQDYLDTLGRLSHDLHDGHGFVSNPGLNANTGLPPFFAEWIEGQAVVTRLEETDRVQVGDVIVKVDGRPVQEIIEQELQTLSGSPQWKRVRAVARLGAGAPDSIGLFEIDRGGEILEVELKRGRSKRIPRTGPTIEQVQDGIYYVDLTRADSAEISARIEELAYAKGIVFDLRGYPNGNHDVICHLIDEPVESAIWNVPQIVYPDRERVHGWDPSGRWNLTPKEPRVTGTVVFITDSSAISYAESVMGIIEHYKLAEIVGAPTAGANGNVNPFTLPGGYRLSWTGMKVLKHDGSQHHLVGIRPTIPATPTLAGVRAGRDELLEIAIARIKDATVKRAGADPASRPSR